MTAVPLLICNSMPSNAGEAARMRGSRTHARRAELPLAPNAAFSFTAQCRNLPDHSLYLIIILPGLSFVKWFFEISAPFYNM